MSVPQVPLAEQNRIADKLDIISFKTRTLTEIVYQKLAALDAFDALKQSVLHQAFSGNL